MAVRNSAVVGVSINQGELRRVSGFGSKDMDRFVFMLASEPVFAGHFVWKSNKMKPGLWQTVRCGHGKDAIQFEERKGIL